MKNILGLLLILAFCFNLSASPLVFKIKKEINSTELIDFVTLDTSKYKQVRIRIAFKAKKAPSPIEFGFYAIEDGDEMYLAQNSRHSIAENENSYVFDCPPSKIKVKVSGNGLVSLYMWGE